MPGLLDMNLSDADPSVLSAMRLLGQGGGGDAGNAIQQLLAQVQPSEADRDEARRQALLQFSLGLLGTQKGHEWQAVGQSGQHALQAQQDYLANLQAQKLHGLQMGGTALDVLNKQYQYSDAQLLRQQQRDAAKRFAPDQPQTLNGPTGQTGLPASSGIGASDSVTQPALPYGMNDRSMGVAPPGLPLQQMRPSGMSPPTGQPVSMQPAVPGGMPDRRQMAARLNAMGDYWSSVGRLPQADTYYKAAQAAMPQLKDQKVYTQNGQRVVVNVYNDGTSEVVPYGPDQEKAHFVDTGGNVFAADPFSGQPVQGTPLYNKTMTPGEVESNRIRTVEVDPLGTLGLNKSNPVTTPGTGQAAPQAQINGAAYLQSLPKQVADQVKALAEGRMQFPAGYALRSPYWQSMLSAVSQYDPSFDAVNYAARSKTRNDFTAGKSAQSINALNTVIGHLGQLSDAADALNNTSYPLLNKGLNFIATQTGDPRVKNFDITRKAVVDELTRVYRGTGGSEKDIQTWSEAINAANSPEQLHSTLAQISDLLESKMNAMGEQYRQGMGTTAQPLQLVTPGARTALDKMEQRATGQPVSSATPQLTPAAKNNATASALVSRVLKSGDQVKIDELRRLGWLQ